MKKRKIKVGDIFVDKGGNLRIIESEGYHLVGYFGGIFRGLSLAFSIDDFRENHQGVSKYYLGNVLDIKPMNKGE